MILNNTSVDIWSPEADTRGLSETDMRGPSGTETRDFPVTLELDPSSQKVLLHSDELANF